MAWKPGRKKATLSSQNNFTSILQSESNIRHRCRFKKGTGYRKKGNLILVTGATGNQGGAAARSLQSNGWPVRFVEMPGEQVRSYRPGMALKFQRFNEKGYQANIPALREMHQKMMTLEDLLRTTGRDKT